MKKLYKLNKGFTLVELLIVVGIIGILATLLMANFIGIRQRARDAQRKSDIRQIQSALEFYRSDLGTYPIALLACKNPLSGGTPINTYMKLIPCDPAGTSYQFNGGNYYYSSNGTTYTLAACLENIADQQGTPNALLAGATGLCTPTLYFVVNEP